MSASNRVRLAAAIASVVIAALLMGAVDRPPAKSAASPTPVVQSSAAMPMVGVGTSEFQNGVAVYRLPSVAVTESRSQALARIARPPATALRTIPLLAPDAGAQSSRRTVDTD